MKNIKRMGYIILIAILVVLSFMIYSNASKSNAENQKDKTFAEIKFIETKLANLLNSMNKLEARNYSVITSEISKSTTEKSNSNNNSSNSGSSEGKASSSKESTSGGGQQDSSSGESSSATEETNNKKFELKANGVLTNTEDINWDIVKNEIESLYVSLPSITMDLYGANLNQEDILGFNTQYDNLTKAVKSENKEQTLTELTKTYEYLPKFLRSSRTRSLIYYFN